MALGGGGSDGCSVSAGGLRGILRRIAVVAWPRPLLIAAMALSDLVRKAELAWPNRAPSDGSGSGSVTVEVGV
jgi:hypothetical protein